MNGYESFLNDVSEWFDKARSSHPREMCCARGCVRCCHGLFDISLPDALSVTRSLGGLPFEARSAVTARAASIQKKIHREAPHLKPPYLLKTSADALIDYIVTRVPGVRCPFLGGEDSCLIYESRPLACRLEGIPMVDDHDGLFGDWCELNFADGVSTEEQEDLRRDYFGLQEVERSTTAALSEALLGEREEAVTVFIPSLIVEYESFWAPLLQKLDRPETGAAG